MTMYTHTRIIVRRATLVRIVDTNTVIWWHKKSIERAQRLGMFYQFYSRGVWYTVAVEDVIEIAENRYKV